LATQKKVTQVEANAKRDVQGTKFVPTAENKKKSSTQRIIALVSWVLAIAAEAAIIFWQLKQDPLNMVLIIILLVVTAVLAIAGSLLWKNANKLDPASKSEPVKFFIQNQLGFFISLIAFVPLIVLVLTNKNMDGKQKGIVAGIAAVLLVIAGYFGLDLNAPSVEEYSSPAYVVEGLMGEDQVYWTESGEKLHLYDSCSYINSSRTDEIFSGTVAAANNDHERNEICKRCLNEAIEEHPDAWTKLQKGDTSSSSGSDTSSDAGSDAGSGTTGGDTDSDTSGSGAASDGTTEDSATGDGATSEGASGENTGSSTSTSTTGAASQ
jgi:hypothetical protein